MIILARGRTIKELQLDKDTVSYIKWLVRETISNIEEWDAEELAKNILLNGAYYINSSGFDSFEKRGGENVR